MILSCNPMSYGVMQFIKLNNTLHRKAWRDSFAKAKCKKNKKTNRLRTSKLTKRKRR